MPINKSDKTKNQQNFSRFKQEAITVNMSKFAKRPPSMNGINKHLP